MSDTRTSRRRFLGAAAVATAGIPLLGRYERFLGGSSARAQDGSPRRLIVFWNPQGNCSGLDTDYAPDRIDPLWPEGNGRDFDLSFDPSAPTPGRILAPLQRHRDDLLLMRGFNLVGGTYTREPCGIDTPDGTHGFGEMVALTAACPYGDGSFAGGVSIDQYVASQIGEATPRPSMVLTCGGTKRGRRGVISYSGPNMPVVPMDPQAAYLSAFGGAVGADRARMAELRSRRGSALDLIRDDTARIRRRLPASERDTLDAQLNALRLLERDFDSDRVCETGAFTDPGDHFPGHFQRQARTVAAAIACDVSRVFSVMAASGGGDTSGNLRFFDPEWTTNYHSSGHASGGNSDGGGDAADTRRRAFEVMVRISEFYARWIADLIDALKAIPEGSGSAFDNTLIVWATEMAHGNHGNHQWPWVIAGGGWKFTNGYYWNQPGASRFSTEYMFGDLLTAIAQAMDIPTERFGHDAFSNGDPDSYSHLWSPGV